MKVNSSLLAIVFAACTYAAPTPSSYSKVPFVKRELVHLNARGSEAVTPAEQKAVTLAQDAVKQMKAHQGAIMVFHTGKEASDGKKPKDLLPMVKQYCPAGKQCYSNYDFIAMAGGKSGVEAGVELTKGWSGAKGDPFTIVSKGMTDNAQGEVIVVMSTDKEGRGWKSEKQELLKKGIKITTLLYNPNTKKLEPTQEASKQAASTQAASTQAAPKPALMTTDKARANPVRSKSW